jgi:diguanylate cyclase (GGDEF)-like protein/PAS domain S-box-containing protein
MPVASVDRAFPIRLLGTVTLGAVLILVAGLAEAWSPLTAVAIADGAAAAVPAAALVSRGVAIRIAVRAGQLSPGACRCVGMFGLGVLAGGTTTVVLALVEPGYRPLVAAGGLIVTAALFAVGLLQIPGIASTMMGQLRFGLDGLVIGTTLAMVGWLLAPQVAGGHPLGYAAAVIAATYVSIAAPVLWRARRQRPATLRCGFGAVLAIVGLALLVVTIGRDVPPWLVLAAAALVVAGPPLIWAGARQVDPAPPVTGSVGPYESSAGYQVLAVPMAAVALAIVYHLLVIGMPDRTAVLLGVAVGQAIALRDLLIAADLRRYAQRLSAQQAHLRALVAGTSDVTMMLDDGLMVRWQSPAAAQQFGLADEDVVGRPLADRIHPDDVVAFTEQLRRVVNAPYEVTVAPLPRLVEARLRDGADRWRETESTISDLRSAPDVEALVVQVRDVGQRRQLERTLHRLASTDQRTGLPNRLELLRAVAARRRGGHRYGALLVVDLHGVAAVSDLCGRAVGDAVLAEAADRLRAQVGPDSVVCGLGDSQFAVVTADAPIEAYALGVRLLAVLTTAYQLPERPVQLQASIGLTGLSTGVSADDVVRRGSLALRQASQLGRDRIEWYDESLEEQLVRRLDLERHLPGAAGRDELDLVYQPVVDLAGDRPVGVVALLRWRHPVLGTVAPSELLPVADKLQVSAEIGEWALHAACRQVGQWRRDGHDLWLAVNVTAQQLTAEEFVPEVAAALSVHQCPPERLTVEIPEAEIGDNLAGVAGQLSKLRALGVRTALDDFGAGHTDLARLRRLPLDVVKFATPPVGGVAGSAGEVAAGVVDLARRLGLTVVADGLETEAQRDLVRGAGCRYGQGQAVAAPAPAERIEAYLLTQPAPSH